MKANHNVRQQIPEGNNTVSYPPRVEYNLTETGCSLMPHIESLVGWALEHMNDILNRRSLQN